MVTLESMMTKKIDNKNIVKVLAFIVTAITLIFLLFQISIAELIATIKNINLPYIGIGFLLYMYSYFFRALRFYFLLNRDVRLKDMFNIVCVSNMVNNILPARIGELSYIYILKEKHYIPSSKGIASMTIARFFDAISILLFFLISIIILRNIVIVPMELIFISALMLLISVLFLGLLLFHGKKISAVIEKVIVNIGAVKFQFIQSLLKLGNNTAENLEKTQSKNMIFSNFITSIFIWIFMYSATYFVLLGVNVKLSILGVIFASILPMLTTVLPVQGIGGFGTTEGAWTIGLMLFGISKETAIASAFTIHIISYVYFLILGFYGLIIFKIKK